MMRPGIRDVAKKLNLSITTVSRALDGYDVIPAFRNLLIEEESAEAEAPQAQTVLKPTTM